MALAGLLLRAAAGSPAAAVPPPGLNVHQVARQGDACFWRGAAPRRATLEALAAAARRRGSAVTLVDLRHPASADDRSGKDGRLSPQEEKRLAGALDLRYYSMSALDRRLIQVLKEALARGNVYVHCMYGVNRTGFAAGRWATATGASVDRTRLGPRDWQQGVAFERRLRRQGAAGR